MRTLKKCLPDIIAIVLFAVISFVYFMPADIDGRVIFQHDSQAGVGAGQEAKTFQEKTGEKTWWTNGLFSGMPTYQISPSYQSTSVLSKAETVYHLGLPAYVWYVFVYLLGFYILLRASTSSNTWLCWDPSSGHSRATSSSSSQPDTSGK